MPHLPSLFQVFQESVVLNHKFALSLLLSVVTLSACSTGSPSTTASTAPNQPGTTEPLDPSQQPVQPVTTTASAPGQQPNQTDTTVVTQAQSDIRVERVQFAPGTTSDVIEDSIRGYETVDYRLGAQAGQYMNVSMATDNGANYFNIMAPGETEVAFFNGSIVGNQYEGALPATGDYTIRVYMMRSAARRNEVANYRLEMVISGQGGRVSTPGSNVPGDALVPGTPYNATGEIPCAISQAEPNSSCPFGVVREGNGTGFVEITTPYGNQFSVYFQNGEAVGAEGGSGSFSSTHSGDETLVYIDEERYIIPDAVIFGG